MADDDRRRSRRADGDDDRLGFDETKNYVSALFGRTVPQFLSRRAVTATIETDRETYELGEPVDIEIEFRNRLPVPVSIRTPAQQLWTWTVDGYPEASERRRYLGSTPSAIDFDARERKYIHRRWDGLVEPGDGERRWVEPDRGEHELAAFIALRGSPRPEARTTIRID